MNLKELRELGAFVDPNPIVKEVTWTRTVNGEEKSDTFPVKIKRQSFGYVDKLINSDDERSRSAAAISASVLITSTGQDGKDVEETMSYEDAYYLEPSLAWVLVRAINEVNEQKKS